MRAEFQETDAGMLKRQSRLGAFLNSRQRKPNSRLQTLETQAISKGHADTISRVPFIYSVISLYKILRYSEKKEPGNGRQL